MKKCSNEECGDVYDVEKLVGADAENPNLCPKCGQESADTDETPAEESTGEVAGEAQAE